VTSNHHLSDEAFTALAHGDGDPGVIRELREAQYSKHLMLIRIVAQAAAEADQASKAVAAFQAGYELLAAVQAADPDSLTWLVGLPHIGAWGHDCLTRLDQGLAPDLGYLADAAASAAVRAGVGFDLDLPVRDGRVLFPGLGYFHGVDADSWIRATSDGKRLSLGAFAEAPCADICPDDGAGRVIPHWTGSPLIRAVTDGQVWEVLLETADPHLDRYTLPMVGELDEAGLAAWREQIQRAWTLLVRHHGWASGPMAAGTCVIVPMAARAEDDLDSATSPIAFGAIATCLPPDPVTTAETLVHEFQHLKLGALLDLVRMVEPSEELLYAPWRPDPRPPAGLLQGVYAHLGVARFWEAQRHVEAEPDDVFLAHLRYERWRPTIELCASTLMGTESLTPEGARFVAVLCDRGRSLAPSTASTEARDIAEELTLDHWLTWQLRHTVADASQVAELAAAYRRGEPRGHRSLPEVRLKKDTREVGSTVRSRLLNLRYLEPQGRVGPLPAGLPGVTAADVLLLDRRAEAAVAAYRDEISAAADPTPAPWIGLALAVRKLGSSPVQEALATRMPVIFDLHAHLSNLGVDSDPLAIADWCA